MSVKSMEGKDRLTLILDNGDFIEFMKALEKWNFKDHQCLLRFAISLLALNENNYFPLLIDGIYRDIVPGTHLNKDKDNLYDTDFYLWTQKTLIDLKNVSSKDELDIQNLMKEIEGIRSSLRRELKNKLIEMLSQLLKFKVQISHQTISACCFMEVTRQEINDLIEESQSLKNFADKILVECYKRAIIKVSSETGFAPESFPEELPWSLKDILEYPYEAEFD